ncbi:MAG: type II secretion system protein GspJ, general secretion pathway protein J [Deltaproteobacteria bacterium CSP1-8]|jgi:general secretion pathway protein J|nr:MAG: type II secretion system protein GspJ, general secretion pathway protein J [Deltaproteobacteria bacterium CSP1-8]
MSGTAGRRGFTLLELLLTLAIFSVVLVLLLSSFTGVERAREILSDRYRDFRQLRMSIDRLGADIQGAFSSDGIEATALTCHEDTFSEKPAATLIFTAFALPESGGPRPASGIVKIRYFPKLGREGRFLELYREESSLPLIENKIPTREVRMADRLLGFRVEFFDGGTWTREWPPGGRKKSALPGKVAFVLTSSSGEEYRRVVPLPLSGTEAAVPFSGRRTEARP